MNAPMEWSRIVALSFCMILFAEPASVVRAADGAMMVAGVPADEALQLGERMYREGILPSGEPLKAIVKGDIPLEHGQFTCAHCHQRSGFGSMEGTVRTWPINGAQLYTPLTKFKRIPARSRAMGAGQEEILRPAYTDETLAQLLTTGVDPSGRQLNSIMPIYSLSDRDMAVLVHYLKNLSVRPDPGLAESVIRFATIVAGDVPQARRDAMVVPLQNFLGNIKTSRTMQRMMRTDAYVQEGTSSGERRFTLSVWELKGPAGTWRSQLEDHYRREQVFAVLGGVAAGDWEPIHRFCEDNRIPAIFPLTDLPALNGDQGYTLYLSKGLAQEGAAAARYLHSRDDLSKDLPVVQIFRPDAAGLALSKAFQEAWAELGHAAPMNSPLKEDGSSGSRSLKGSSAERGPAVYVLWLKEADFPDLNDLLRKGKPGSTVLASLSLLGKGGYSLPEQHRASVYLTYPYRLPQNSSLAPAMSAASRTGAAADPELLAEAKVQSLFALLRGPLLQLSIRSFVSREYFMELLEGTPDLTSDPVPFPRLSFGTGQRYASKGCYVVQLSPGHLPQLVNRTAWVIP